MFCRSQKVCAGPRCSTSVMMIHFVSHFCVAKTLELISRGYWWTQPWNLLKEFVKSCDDFVRCKASHYRPYGLLQPLPIPKRPWASLSMDFITDLPLVGGYDSVFIMVNRFTKMAHFAPCAKTITGEETADLFFKNVVLLHGLLDDITSDRGPQFVSNFWWHLLQTFGCTINLSSGYNLPTDGQMKRVNQILEQYLRCSLNYQQDDWVGLLSLTEFAYNNSFACIYGSYSIFCKLRSPPTLQHFSSLWLY